MFLKNKNIKLRIIVILLSSTIVTTNITPAFASTQTSITLETQATKEQMISFYEENFPESYPQEYIEQGIELADFVDIIIEEARTEEVRADLVFAQVLIETNNLQFDGEFSIEKNNFGNLQEANGEYITYDSIADGIRASILLLNSFESENWFEELEYSETVNQYLEEILNTNIIEETEESEQPEQPPTDQHEEYIGEQETEEESETEDFEEDLSEDKDEDKEAIIRDESANSISNVKVEFKAEDKKTNFKKSDKYFKVDKNTPIYDNRTGSLVKVGELSKGQVYPRTRDYGANWHEIQFGNIKGYIYKPDTSLATGNEIKNKNTSYKNQGRTFKALGSVPVYDNTSGSLVQFGTIDKGKTYPIAFDYGNWFSIILSDRVGYVHKNNVEVNFLKSDKYFRAKNNTPIYDNRTGSLVKVGELAKGQVYPRLRDYGANWHEIQYGNIKGYVLKADTSLATGNEIKNKNTSYKNQARIFKALSSIPVYDNTSGSLVQFGTIDKGKTYPIAFDYGNWLGIILSDRVGYVHKNNVEVNFFKSDKYFRVKKNTPIYDNRTGSLVKLGELTKGQVYPRLRDYGANWHEIQYGNIKGYVLKADTSIATGNEIKNKNTSYKNQAQTFEALREVPVYDNTSGSLVQIGTINKGIVYYPLAFDYGNWLGIIFADRVGYVHKNHIDIIDKVNIKYSHYNQTFEAQLIKQMKASPQTDYRGGGWQNAKESEVRFFLDPINFIDDERAIFQFLDLSKPSSVSVSDLNKLLKGKGILEGRGSSFSQASQNHEINVIYLLAHANLETGNGTSKLAKGVRVDAKGRMVDKDGILIDSKENYVDKNGSKSETPIKGEGSFKTVYNMFGIGAYDSDPIRLGAGRAFKEDWTTVNKAITGGTKFVAQNYIYNEMYGYQNTLYKMRWNPTNLKSYADHQYATDIGWAYKQANIIKTYYDQLSYYVLYFDIPEYK